MNRYRMVNGEDYGSIRAWALLDLRTGRLAFSHDDRDEVQAELERRLPSYQVYEEAGRS